MNRVHLDQVCQYTMQKINKLTGRPISEDSIKMLHRLENNEKIALEEIELLPEIQEAYSCISNSTPTILLKNRKYIDAHVIDILSTNGSYSGVDALGNACYNGSVGNDKRIDIVIGLPASGKSSTIVNPISREFHSKVIDSDMAKELLPEFNGGWGAGVVHEESKDITEYLLQCAFNHKQNIVYPVVGSNFKKLSIIIALANTQSYSVYIHYADITPMRALGRMINRFFETGRFLDPKLIYHYNNNVVSVYNTLKEVYKNERKQITRIEHDYSRNGGKMRPTRHFSNELVPGTSGNMGASDNRTSGFNEQSPGGSRTEITISGYSRWSTDVPRSSSPILLESTCKGHLFERSVILFCKNELSTNGFQLTPSLLQKMLQLQQHTIRLYPLKEICHLYHNPSLCTNDDIRNLVQSIGKECSLQEHLNFPTPEA